MPFDGKDVTANQAAQYHFAGQFRPGNSRFEIDPTRPTTQNSPLFGLDGAEWRGFYLGLIGVLALVMGISAMLLSLIGN